MQCLDRFLKRLFGPKTRFVPDTLHYRMTSLFNSIVLLFFRVLGSVLTSFYIYQEVLGSIPGSTVGFFSSVELFHGSYELGAASLVEWSPYLTANERSRIRFRTFLQFYKWTRSGTQCSPLARTIV